MNQASVEELRQALGAAVLEVAQKLNRLGNLSWFDLELELGTRGESISERDLRRSALVQYLDSGLLELQPDGYALGVTVGDEVIVAVIPCIGKMPDSVKLALPSSLQKFVLTARYNPEP